MKWRKCVYEAREGGIRWETAKQKYICASKSLSVIVWNIMVSKWYIPRNSSDRILNSDTSIREILVIRSGYLAPNHDHFQPGYCIDRASCKSNAEENKGDISKILLLSRVSHTTFSNELRENNINFLSYYFICI